MEQRGASVGQAPSEEAFKTVLGRFATGVSVMTATVGATRHGMTANAVASLSLDPPLVLVCVERSAKMADRVEAAGAFGLSFLAADQADLSVWFADGSRTDTAQFAEVATFEAVTGSPLLVRNVGWVDCRVWAVYDGGDHVIVIGEVVELGTGDEDEPLIYYRSDYGRFAT